MDFSNLGNHQNHGGDNIEAYGFCNLGKPSKSWR